jgi:transcription elongation factor Elf1
MVARIVIGVICLGAAAALVALVRLKPTHQTHVHHTKLDLSGDVSLQELTCKQCGATLSEKSVAIKAGAAFVTCEFCSAEYQLEEAPKW